MKSDIFIDWITIKQTHPEDLPVINNGSILIIKNDGSIEQKIDKYLKIEGSYETKVMVRCNANTVELSGNVGRMNRIDNLFNFDIDKTIEICNKIMRKLNLPLFTSGKSYYYKNEIVFTGAKITRLDVTCNIGLGNQSNINKFFSFLGNQHYGRLKNRVMPDGHSVVIGMGSRYISVTIYNKLIEMEKHIKKQDQDVLDYTYSKGIVRFEARLRSQYLKENGISYLGNINQKKIENAFRKKFNEIIVERAIEVDQDIQMTKTELKTYGMWLSGISLREIYSKAQYYRLRRNLLKHGIDISIPYIKGKSVRREIIKIEPLLAPDWYLETMRKVA